MGRNKKLFSVGIAGTVIAALCCFTPVLVILFGVVGLSALVRPGASSCGLRLATGNRALIPKPP